ncbi:hypothetical protein ACMD2_19679, partial [Ananas comosus]
GCKICNIPLTVRRPTLKEVKRLYNHLIQMTYEVDYTASGEVLPSIAGGNSVQQSNDAKQGKHLQIEESISNPYSSVECKIQHSNNREQEKLLEIDDSSSRTVSNLECKYEATSQPSFESETTPLHEAAKSGDAQRTLELLEQGLNPCIRDERGRTPYMLATEKEVRNTFRRFMALNLDKWDWHAANVPSALTKEMEEFQAAKQAEKDARRKAKAKEMKKLKKEKEKAKAEASLSQSSRQVASHSPAVAPISAAKQQKPQYVPAVTISKEEERQRPLAEEREKRAAAAERRIAALAAKSTSTSSATPQGSSEPTSGLSDPTCSCCNASLAGKIPFHRYHYKYCSTSCMHVHREMLEDG